MESKEDLKREESAKISEECHDWWVKYKEKVTEQKLHIITAQIDNKIPFFYYYICLYVTLDCISKNIFKNSSVCAKIEF